MWIRTSRGIILNSDLIEVIKYNDDTDTTRAYVQGDENAFYILAEGDITERIANALSRNANYVEVINRG